MGDENRTFQLIVATGKRLFFRFGLKKVTVEEIAVEAGLSKVTFYKYFPNKYDLFIRVVRDMADESLHFMKDVMARDLSYHDIIGELLAHKFHAMKEYSPEFITDYLERLPELKSILGELYARAEEIYAQMYARGREEGVLRETVTFELFMYYITQAQKIFDDPEYAVLIPAVDERIKELSYYIFYGVMNTPGGGKA